MACLLCVSQHNRHEQIFKVEFSLKVVCTIWMNGSYCTCVT